MMHTWKKSVWLGSLILLLSLLGFLGGWLAGETRSHAEETAISEDTYENLRTLIQAMSLIRANYVDEAKIKQQDLVYGAIKGMVGTLDPYSQFMDPQSYKDMKQDTQGSFGGLGIEIAIRDNVLTVISPIDGTPAQRAGVQPGDMIMKINGETTDGLSIMDAVHKMRGPAGTKCVLTLRRAGDEEWFDLTIIRDIIQIHSVRYELLSGQIGYIRITEFMEHTGEDFERALKDLQSRGMKGLVLDLRNNPGGLLNMAAEISEYFVPQGRLLVYTEGRNQNQNMRFFSTAKRPYNNGPLAVLVNQGSASASEIVAGALQDWNLGLIVGEKTFGKGSVQTIMPLNDGSALRITTARYLTPKGRLIHGNGITPDVGVEPFKPNDYTLQLSQDRRYEEFVRAYLKLHPQGEEAEAKTAENVKVSEQSWEKLKPKTADEKLTEAFVTWLKDQRVEVRKADLNEDLTFVLSRIREELALKLKGMEAARKVSLENDVQVQRAKDAIGIALRYGAPKP
jgi:carboxyl-terminal processing protease